MTLIQSPIQLTLAEFLERPETKPASEYARLVTAINQAGQSQQSALALTELRCTFGGRSIVPDVSVFEWQRIPRKANGRIANKFEISPDWVIEILSPDQSPSRVIDKIIFCLKQQGTKLGWFIEPEDESVMVFQPNQLPDVKYDAENLPVLEVLGDWQLSVADVFNWLQL